MSNAQDISVEASEQLEHERKECDGPPLPVFTSRALEVATDGYANKNKLGQGGFGPVHKVPSFCSAFFLKLKDTSVYVWIIWTYNCHFSGNPTRRSRNCCKTAIEIIRARIRGI